MQTFCQILVLVMLFAHFIVFVWKECHKYNDGNDRFAGILGTFIGAIIKVAVLWGAGTFAGLF